MCQIGWDTWNVGDTMDNLHTRLVRRYVFVCEYVLAARDMGDTVGERRAHARAHYLVLAMRRYPSVDQMATAREVCGLAL